MLTNESKKTILSALLRTIKIISDQCYQHRIWIRGEGPEVSDFDETCCFFFDEADCVIHNYQDFGLSQNQYQILKSFYDEFDIFADNNYSEFEFIDTPEWARIRSLAKAVLEAFDYQGSQD